MALWIDVSEHQGVIDWARVKASGIAGAIIRTSYGTRRDYQLDRNLQGATAAGVPIGLYLYSTAGAPCEMQKEIDFMLSIAHANKITLPLYWDIEEGDQIGTAAPFAKAWVGQIKSAGFIPGIYTGRSYYHASSLDQVGGASLWLAEYGSARLNSPAAVDAWQWTCEGHVDGINGDVDLSYAYKDFTPKKPRVVVPAEPNGVHRLYDPAGAEHFFTTGRAEAQALADIGWIYEGIGWHQGHDKPVRRMFYPPTSQHHYPATDQERDALVGLGWRYEGLAWYSAGSDGLPVYRLAKDGRHHYTTSTVERDVLTASGWTYEGVNFYAAP